MGSLVGNTPLLWRLLMLLSYRRHFYDCVCYPTTTLHGIKLQRSWTERRSISSRRTLPISGISKCPFASKRELALFAEIHKWVLNKLSSHTCAHWILFCGGFYIVSHCAVLKLDVSICWCLVSGGVKVIDITNISTFISRETHITDTVAQLFDVSTGHKTGETVFYCCWDHLPCLSEIQSHSFVLDWEIWDIWRSSFPSLVGDVCCGSV